jgi:hypothetical protein
MKKLQLSLDGRVSKVMYFSEDDIWFEAKPLVLYLEYSPTQVGGNAQEYLRRVLKQKLKKSRKSPSVEEHIRQLIASTVPETWPMSSSDVDVFQLDASEEKLGAEMEQ